MNIKQLVLAAVSTGLIALQTIVAPQGSAVAPISPPGISPANGDARRTAPRCRCQSWYRPRRPRRIAIRPASSIMRSLGSAHCEHIRHGERDLWQPGQHRLFAAIEAGSGASTKNFLLRPGQTVALAARVSGTKVTVTASRGSTFKKVSADPADAPYQSVGLGGWDIPGNLLPALTTNARFSSVMVNNTSLVALPSVRTSLSNGSVVTMRPTAVNGSGGFTDVYLRRAELLP